jgi:phosphoglycerate dehydrogenase-like enzyme
MMRTTPENTKLTICVWHPFTEWRPPASLAEGVRKRWPAMRVVHLPDYDGLRHELPDTDIFVATRCATQLLDAKIEVDPFDGGRRGAAMYQVARPGILVTNPSGIFSVPMAEHTMGVAHCEVAILRIPCVTRTNRAGGNRSFGISRSASRN